MAEENRLSAPDWSDVQRVLVIMAHPDDPDFTCAGTVIQMARQGIDVTYMILTNGDKGNHNPEITRNQLIAMRKIEQQKAADLCGVNQVLFLGEEDGFLRPTRSIRKRVTREIRRIRPATDHLSTSGPLSCGRWLHQSPRSSECGPGGLGSYLPCR